MKTYRLLSVLGAIGALSAQAYTYEADFNVTDGADGTPAMTPRQETIFSHWHAEVRDGTYAVLVSGNRHYLATPKLRDFRLELNLAFDRLLGSEYDLGFSLRFRDDRAGRYGHALRIAWKEKGELAVELGDKEIFRGPAPVAPRTFSVRPVLEVKGRRGTLSVVGKTVAFDLPDDDEPGYVSLDALYYPALTMTVAAA